jgi:hypothetical protein
MSIETKENTKSPIVREYIIGGKKYNVTSSVKAGVKEDAAAIVRRLIKKEIVKKVG